MYYVGIDIGGTKCAASLGRVENGGLEIIEKRKIPTAGKRPYSVLVELLSLVNELIESNGVKQDDVKGIGISCGGPLDSKNGIIMSPPNLPGWDNVKAAEFFENTTGIKTSLQNDANACAVAEWKYGAGQGHDSMIFITFGTGFGAGLIINGALYSGAHDNAGEIGHVRLTDEGPEGYYKHGSVEGWCSGAGIAKIGVAEVEKAAARGEKTRLLEAAGSTDNITAKLIGDLAEQEGDSFCKGIYRICAEKLGAALSILIDVVDPELIVMGGIYMRSAALLDETFRPVIKREALSSCPIVPAGLGERVGDYAALAIAALNGGTETETPVKQSGTKKEV